MKNLFILIFTFSFVVFIPTPVLAQNMMGRNTGPTVTIQNSDIVAQQKEELDGKVFVDNLNNKSVTCDQLTDSDFEKIGEYFMGISVGNTAAHISMNNRMKAMMGESGESQMHIALGKRSSGCDTSAQFLPNGRTGGKSMTGWNNYGMMNGRFADGGGFSGPGFFGIIFHGLIFIDLVLLGLWLWKQLRKK